MALRLLERGFDVAAYDIDRAAGERVSAAGALVCDSAAAVACGCDAVIVAVVDAAQTRGVLFGVQGVVLAARRPDVVMLSPTIAAEDTEAIAAQLQAAGIATIDAPMSAGPERARAGTMSLMLACRNDLFERHRDWLEALSSRIFRLGERIGDGARTKLVNNLLAAVNLAGAAEALALARRVGLQPALTLEVIECSSGQSWIASDRLRRALEGDPVPRARMSLLRKDSALAVAMARRAGFGATLGEQAATLFEQACAAGCTELDDSSLLEYLDAARP